MARTKADAIRDPLAGDWWGKDHWAVKLRSVEDGRVYFFGHLRGCEERWMELAEFQRRAEGFNFLRGGDYAGE